MAKEKPVAKNKHPYMSGTAGVTQAVNHLRRQFPQSVTADTLRKLGIAPNNESYVLNILRFVGVIDANGTKTQVAGPIFNQADDSEFQKGFAALIKSGYADLFQLHGDAAWDLPQAKLISFFRNSDQTSELVGGRQTSTFAALAALAGKRQDAPKIKPAAITKPPKTPSTTKVATKSRETSSKSTVQVQAGLQGPSGGNATNVGLTVRIEINLPAGGDQATYDAIFRSIRAHLINGDVV